MNQEEYHGQNMVKCVLQQMSRFDCYLMWLFPNWWIKRVSRKMGIQTTPLLLHNAVSQFDNVHISPSKSGQRGFRLVFDDEVALYFYQNGDHFEYDGWEIGKYDKGESVLNLAEVIK